MGPQARVAAVTQPGGGNDGTAPDAAHGAQVDPDGLRETQGLESE